MFHTGWVAVELQLTTRSDPVPRLPPLLFDFVHISPQYYINKPNLQNVLASDISVYSGSINLLQGNEAWVATDIGAHLWYFNSITVCFVDELLGG